MNKEEVNIEIMEKLQPGKWNEGFSHELIVETPEVTIYLVTDKNNEKYILKWVLVKPQSVEEEMIYNEYYNGLKANEITLHTAKEYALAKKSVSASAYSDYFLIIISEYGGHKLAAGLFMEDVLDIAYQLSTAMSSLHKSGFVHMDLKAENITQKDGVVKLIDFGISIVLKEESFKPNKLLGIEGEKLKGYSKQYAPPEILQVAQGKMNSKHINPFKAEVFSYGIIFFEQFLTKEIFPISMQPRNSEEEFTKFNKIAWNLMKKYELAEGIGLPLGNIIKRCLSYKPENRPDFDWIKTELENFIKKDSRWHYIIENEKKRVEAFIANKKEIHIPKKQVLARSAEVQFIDHVRPEEEKPGFTSEDSTMPLIKIPMNFLEFDFYLPNTVIKHITLAEVTTQEEKVNSNTIHSKKKIVDLPIFPTDDSGENK